MIELTFTLNAANEFAYSHFQTYPWPRSHSQTDNKKRLEPNAGVLIRAAITNQVFWGAPLWSDTSDVVIEQ